MTPRHGSFHGPLGAGNSDPRISLVDPLGALYG